MLASLSYSQPHLLYLWSKKRKERKEGGKKEKKNQSAENRRAIAESLFSAIMFYTGILSSAVLLMPTSMFPYLSKQWGVGDLQCGFLCISFLSAEQLGIIKNHSSPWARRVCTIGYFIHHFLHCCLLQSSICPKRNPLKLWWSGIFRLTSNWNIKQN